MWDSHPSYWQGGTGNHSFTDYTQTATSVWPIMFFLLAVLVMRFYIDIRVRPAASGQPIQRSVFVVYQQEINPQLLDVPFHGNQLEPALPSRDP